MGQEERPDPLVQVRVTAGIRMGQEERFDPPESSP